MISQIPPKKVMPPLILTKILLMMMRYICIYLIPTRHTPPTLPLSIPISPCHSPSLISIHLIECNQDTMEAVLHLRLISFALLGVLTASLPQARLLNSSNLEMFVDQLPHLPKILGFHLVSGIPKSKSLEIGMFKKKWVICFFFFILVLYEILFSFSIVATSLTQVLIPLTQRNDQLMLLAFALLRNSTEISLQHPCTPTVYLRTPQQFLVQQSRPCMESTPT